MKRTGTPGKRAGTPTLESRWRGGVWLFVLLTMLCLSFSRSAAALPQGESVAYGSATFSRSASQLTINQATHRAIINYSDFSIAGSELVNFVQPSSSSAVLNRVVGALPSGIMGTLTANGNILLLNPNGISIGSGAQINVHGLIASTLSLSDSDFINGEYVFHGTGAEGSVINQGLVDTRSFPGGHVFFIGPGVENWGDIFTSQGSASLVSGTDVYLTDSAAGLILARVDVPLGLAANLGNILSDGGRIDIYGEVVNQSGYVSANAVAAGPTGEIRLVSQSDTILGAGSVTEADQGDVTIDSGGHVSMQNSAEIRGGDGAVYLEADADIGMGVDARIVSQTGGVSLNAALAITMDDTSAIDAGSGTINLEADQDIHIGSIRTTNDTAAAVRIHTAAGGVLDTAVGDSAVDIEANSPGAVVTIESQRGVGGGDEYLETTVNAIDVTNGPEGKVRIRETDDLIIRRIAQGAGEELQVAIVGGQGDLTIEGGGGGITSAGTVELSVQGGLTVNDAITAGGSVSLYAYDDVFFGSEAYVSGDQVSVHADFAGGGAPGGGIFMVDGAFVDAGAGTITLRAEDSIWLGGLLTTDSTGSAVLIESSSGEVIDNGDMDVDIVANSPGAVTTVTAAKGVGITPAGGADAALEVYIHNVDGATDTGGINLRETDAIDITRLAASTWGSVNVAAAGTIAVLNQGFGISTAGAGRTDDVRLTSTGGDIVATRIVASDTAFLTAGGEIMDGGEDVTDIVAPYIGLVAQTGIANDDMLEVDATGLAARTQSGDVNITDVGGGLEITQVETVDGVTVTGGHIGDDIVIIAQSPLRVSHAVTNIGGGRIMLVAEGATEADDLTLDASVIAAGADGDIVMFSGDSIIHMAEVSTSGEGAITMQAGVDYAGGEAQPGMATGEIILAPDSVVTADAGDITMHASARVSLSGSVVSEGGDVYVAADELVGAEGSLLAAATGSIEIDVPLESVVLEGTLAAGEGIGGAAAVSEKALLAQITVLQSVTGEMLESYQQVAYAAEEIAPAEEEEEEEAEEVEEARSAPRPEEAILAFCLTILQRLGEQASPVFPALLLSYAAQ